MTLTENLEVPENLTTSEVSDEGPPMEIEIVEDLMPQSTTTDSNLDLKQTGFTDSETVSNEGPDVRMAEDDEDVSVKESDDRKPEMMPSLTVGEMSPIVSNLAGMDIYSSSATKDPGEDTEASGDALKTTKVIPDANAGQVEKVNQDEDPTETTTCIHLDVKKDEDCDHPQQGESEKKDGSSTPTQAWKSAEDILDELIDFLETVNSEIEQKEDEQASLSSNETTGRETYKSTLQNLWNQFEAKLLETKPSGIEKQAGKTCLQEIRSIVKKDDDITYTVLALLDELHRLSKCLRFINLDKLFALLDCNQDAGAKIEGKDVVLLLGDSGVGKTTTLQFLGGATFEEEFLEGFEHIQAVSFPNNLQVMRSYQTSYGTASVTRSLQAIEVVLDGKPLVVCDTPGFLDSDGVEVDIANGLGLVRQVWKAKSIRPVLVLSKDGMGSRFQAVSDSMKTITRMLGGSPCGSSLAPFNYIFTKYEAKYRTHLHRQFQKKLEQLTSAEKKDAFFVSIVQDIVAKTNPEAHIICPLDGDPQSVLRSVWGDAVSPSLHPTAFVSFVSEKAETALQLQIKTLTENVKGSFERRSFEYSAYCLGKLMKLDKCLPDIKADLAVEVSMREKIIGFRRETHRLVSDEFFVIDGNFSETMSSLKQRFDWIVESEPLRVICAPAECSGRDFSLSAAVTFKMKTCQQVLNIMPSDQWSAADAVSVLETVGRVLNHLQSAEKTFIGLCPMPWNLATLGECLESTPLRNDTENLFQHVSINHEQNVSVALQAHGRRFFHHLILLGEHLEHTLGELVTNVLAESSEVVGLTPTVMSRTVSRLVQSATTDYCGSLSALEAASSEDRSTWTALIAKLDEEALAQNEMIDVSSKEALKFLTRLQHGEDAMLVLSEILCTHHWEDWVDSLESRLAARNKKGLWRRFTSSLGLNRPEAPSPAEQRLRTVLDKIVRIVHTELQRSLKQLLGEARTLRMSGSHQILHFVSLYAKQLRVFVEFAKMRRESSSPASCRILEPRGELRYILESATAFVGDLIQLLNQSWRAALDKHQFRDIDSFLAVAKRNGDTLNRLKECAGISYRNRLVSSIGFCTHPDYSMLCKEVKAMFQEVEAKTVNLVFYDNPRLKTLNEDDRLEVYKEALSTLTALAESSWLENHLSSVDITNVYEKAQKRIIDETDKIGQSLNELMATFPSQEFDFRNISIWLGNLADLKTVFLSGNMDAVVGRAQNLLDATERDLHRRFQELKEVLSGSGDDLVESLLKLKKASLEVVCWRSLINKYIDEYISEAALRAPNPGRYILDLHVKLENVTGDDADIVSLLLSDHQCFEGAMNVVFNTATARQGIEYVLNRLRLPVTGLEKLKKMYSEFETIYQDLLRRGLSVLVHEKETDRPAEFYRNLVIETKLIANDFSLDYSKQLCHLTAYIFAQWSLKSSNEFALFEDESAERSLDDAALFLMKPHAAQVITVWLMLGGSMGKHQRLENHLARVKTGEGKSIVLGVSALVLGLMGFDVTCICYSSYLSKRDRLLFRDLFDDHGVAHKIQYSSIDDLCNTMLKGTWSLVSQFVEGTRRLPDRINGRDESHSCKVLLVDEVDVLFKEEFYGETFNPAPSWTCNDFEDLIRLIWSDHHRFDESLVLQTDQAKKVIAAVRDDFKPLIEKHIQDMVWDAKRVGRGDHVKYLLRDNKVYYKIHDELSSGWTYGYETLFLYMKEHQQGNISATSLQENLFAEIKSGNISFAELPFEFDAILGVTGTLEGLSDNEKTILRNDFGIENYSYLPSVYGENQLRFSGDNARDLIIGKTEADQFLEIRHEIDRRRKPVGEPNTCSRAVMVFLSSSESVQRFYNSEHMVDLKSQGAVRTITESIRSEEKEGAFLNATKAGAITLMIRDFGRGTDFKCYDSKMLDAGGVHVIQAFFSVDLSEEIQIKGRTARQGAQGSYSLILNAEQLHTDLSVTSEEIEGMKRTSSWYSFLDKRREQTYSQELERVCTEVKSAEDKHYRTLAFFEALSENRHREPLQFLLECNGMGASNAFSGNNLKAKFIRERQDRIRKREALEKSRRAAEQRQAEQYRLRLCSPDWTEDTSHYAVLGVEKTATTREIIKAYRGLARIHHPDRNQEQGEAASSEPFLRIQLAKEILSCQSKRAAYDQELEEAC